MKRTQSTALLKPWLLPMIRSKHPPLCCVFSMPYGNPLGKKSIWYFHENLHLTNQSSYLMLVGHGVCLCLFFISNSYSELHTHFVCCPSLYTAEFLYGIFQHQACVYRSRDQYDRSHEILTDVLDLETTREVRYCWTHINYMNSHKYIISHLKWYHRRCCR